MSTQITSATPHRAGETQQQSEDDNGSSEARLALTGEDADDVWKACAEHGWFGADTPDYTFVPRSKCVPARGA